jgi:hypothetical protein
LQRFDLHFESEQSPAEVLRDCLSLWTGQLADYGYSLISQSDIGISYRRTYWRWYVILLAALLFPIGLLFLLSRADATITATLEPRPGGGTKLAINGLAPKNVCNAFEELQI